MTDSDIPVAYGTPIGDPMPYAVPVQPPAPPANSGCTGSSSANPIRDLRTATAINGGSSSRVGLPNRGQESHRLLPQDVQALREQGYTSGLAHALMKNKLALPLSIWVVDNSGSMIQRDGHRLVTTSRKHEVKLLPCTRWTEMQETVQYHAQLAALLDSPTVFRLLNDPGRHVGPQQFSIAERGEAFLDEDLAIATSTIMNASPNGVTPLVQHLYEIRSNVLELESNLRRDGTKVVIVLATDGIPTDEHGYANSIVKQQFVDALRALEGLPIWIVIRLCTDEDNVVQYWNDLDSNLELSLEVLDDFESEAKEIYEYNKWLTYGLPLHRMRELGFSHRVLDLLDERKLAKDELRDFFRILLGDHAMAEIPDPEMDWETFVQRISDLVAKEDKQWNPITHRMEPWINIRQLKRDYGGGWFSGLW